MPSQTILIIAPPEQGTALSLEPLRQLGCRVCVAAGATEGIVQALRLLPDFVLLAESLPDGDPLEICRRLRSSLPEAAAPIYLLAAPEDSGGGGSPLGKLCLRIARMIVEHAPPDNSQERFARHGLEMDRRRFRAAIDRRPLKLTPTEFRLLWQLASQPGFVHDRRELARSCLGPDTDVQDRTIDAHIKSIRHKLAPRADLIETVRGIGYRFQELEAESAGESRRTAVG